MPFFSFQGIPYKKKVASGIAPLKRIQNVPARPLFSIAQENKPFILPSTAFSVPGWYKSIPKKKKPVTGLPGAYTGILHFKA